MTVGSATTSDQRVETTVAVPSALRQASGLSDVTWLAYGLLEIEVRPDGGQYIALEHHTGMFGEGDTAHEALDDLVGTLNDHHRDLMTHQPRGLAQHLQDQLAALSNSLRR